MNIQGKKIVLKAVEAEDLPLIHKWSNSPEITRMLGGWHFPSSLSDQQEWFDNLSLKSNDQRFSIYAEEFGLIGVANLVNINWKDGNAFHGMLIGDKDIRGKGYGIDTILTIMKYAFEDLRLERLDGTMIEYNEPSINVYVKKCGWKIEGRKKNKYFREGRFWDEVVVGITKDEYFDFLKTLK